MRLLISLFVFLSIFSTTGCKNQKMGTLENQMKKIDGIPLSQSVYIIEVDSNKIIIDTLALRKLKFDDNKDLVFEKNIQLKQNLETISYYDSENGMIYSKSEKDGKKISEFRVNLENGFIISANFEVYENDIKDSVFMKYHYTIDRGIKTKLLIDSGDGFNTIELYNEAGKPIFNFSLDQKDTIEKTVFIYDKENKLKEKRFKNFLRNDEVIYEYNNDFIVRETFLNNSIEKFQTEYYKDKDGNYLSYTKAMDR